MNILWINHRDPKHPSAGGAEVRIHEIGRRLVQNGHSVKLVCERWSGSKKVEFLDGIEIVRVAGKYDIHYKVPLLISKSYGCDVIIDDIAHAIPWESQFFTNKSVIGQVHHVHQSVLDLELNPFLARIIALSERAIKYYRAVIVVSESTKDDLIQLGVSKNKIKVIPNGVDTSFYQPVPKIDLPTILWVGRVKRYKRVDHVLLAFSMIQKKIPNANLIIVGSGDQVENLKVLAKKLHLSNVIFTGVVDEERKAMLMGSSWLTISTSFVEGWGLTITESAACGTPAVAYDVSGLRDSIRNNETGLLVSDGNVADLAQASLRVLQDEKLRTELGNNALKWARQFSWDKITEDFADFLKLN